jgi:molybdopterin synthase sulfur carrier subunit
MGVKVRIPTPLQKLTNGKADVECGAQDISGMIDMLERDYPGMKERLTDGGKVRRFINIYVNDEDIRFLNKEETALKDGDTISIVPAIAGGRCSGAYDTSRLCHRDHRGRRAMRLNRIVIFSR